MIVPQQLDDGRYVHRCDKCGDSRVVKYPTLKFKCRCVDGVPPERSPALSERQPPRWNAAAPPPKFGDKVKGLLASYGITEEWYLGFKAKFGDEPTCGCKSRAAWLNSLEESHPHIAGFGSAVAEMFTRKRGKQ